MDKFVASLSPHIHSGESTSKIMRDVVIALVPAFAVSVFIYGMDSVILTVTSVICCIVFEYLIQKFLIKGKNTITNWSAVVTGVLLAFNLPSTLPLWIVVLGALVAIGVGKMSFGGLGRNPFNPALVGRVFLLISFPAQMTYFAPVEPSSFSKAEVEAYSGATITDAFSGATPLAYVKEAIKKGESLTEIMPKFSYTDLLLGSRSGSLGEIAALALILGFIYLLWRRVITWHIPVYVLGSMALLSGILWGVDPEKFVNPLFQILTGGALLGAIFMATDYVTSPMTHWGIFIYAAGIGVITILIRTFGAYPEGMSFAILIMNAVVPLLAAIKPRRFGRVVKKA